MTRGDGDGSRVGREALVERARGLAPMLRARVAETERDRRVAAEVIAEIRARDIFRILQPRAFGGFEHDWEVMVAVSFELAAACGSTGWVAALGIGHNWFVAKFPVEAQRDVWGDDPGALVFGSYTPAALAEPAGDGYRLSGRWRFSSGCDNGAWGLLGALLPPERGEGPPRPCFVLVPAAEYAIEDDWHAMGLVGTGSKTIVCEGAFVPAHRVLDFAAAAAGTSPGGAHHASPLYRMPLLTCIPMCICTPPLGILHGAIKAFREGLIGRASRGAIVSGGRTIADYAAVQTHFAEAAASLDAARLLILRDIAEAGRIADAGEAVPERMRIRNRLDQAFAVRLAVQGINGLFDAGGGSGIFLDNHVQRAWRDINAAARHIAFSWGAVSTMYGQSELGRPITSSVGY